MKVETCSDKSILDTSTVPTWFPAHATIEWSTTNTRMGEGRLTKNVKENGRNEARMMVKDNPSGAKMFKRTITVKENVRDILQAYPSARGDDRILIWRYLRRFTPLRISFETFEQLRAAPAFETIRRRSQEIRAADPTLQPTDKTIAKRERREQAFKHYFSKGNLTLNDYINGENE